MGSDNRSMIGSYIDDFINHKIAFGAKYITQKRILMKLDNYLARNNYELTPLTFDLYIESIKYLTGNVILNHQGTIHSFCLYRQKYEPNCYVPDPSQFVKRIRSKKPYIFEMIQIEYFLMQLLKKKNKVGTKKNRNELIGFILLYTTGMRVGELVRLKTNDYDYNERTLFIRDSKYHKERLIPISNDARQYIEEYLDYRKRNGIYWYPESPLIISCSTKNNIEYTPWGFSRILISDFRKYKILKPEGGYPRVHDLRHTFAVHVLLKWYEQSKDVQSRLPYLSLYMGHSSIKNTEYYLKYIIPVATKANGRFEEKYADLIK